MVNNIKSKFMKYVLGSSYFKDLNDDLDHSTNNGKDFDVDSDDQYAVYLFDVEKEGLSNLLPYNSEYILMFMESDIMNLNFLFKLYIDGEFRDVDTETNDLLESYGDDLMSNYENAIMMIDYPKWLEMREKTSKVIHDINENISKSNLEQDFRKYIITDPEYMKINKKIDDDNFGYYHADLYSSKILRNIHMYPGVMKVPDNLLYFILVHYQISDGFKTLYHVYDKEDGFRLPTEKEEEVIIRNDSAQNFSTNNYVPIFGLTSKEYLEVKNKQEKLFKNINESDIKVVTSFSKFKKTL